ncbi:hypothetical protein NHX12_030859 [Muraenolepis orangiensis]|uniref:RHD domain-containing protein n=1 Tax=Muraenolepis orangiensis TaxID=630683 RepID=A0A9Q0IM18_9TELE|nr:hypothetical protein NHX12_030859 [Muraenolepis orangiensis]
MGNIPTPSPRIEITPSADSLSSPPPSEPSPGSGSTALGPYRDRPCVSPASSNSSTGWPIEGCSPSASPSISPANGGSADGLSALDLGPSVQGIAATFSAHSSPGASPGHSVTEDTFLVPQHHRTASPLPQQRSRSVSPKGKRPYDREHGVYPCLGGGTPVKQRSRSPSPIPVPVPVETSGNQDHRGSYRPPCYQVVLPSETRPQAGACSPSLLEDMLGSLVSPGLPEAVAPSNGQEGGAGEGEESCVYDVQAPRQDLSYGDGWGWNTEQRDGRRSRPGVEVLPPEPLYVLPHGWPSYVSAGHKAFSAFPVPPLEWPLPSQSGPYELVIHQQPKAHHRAHYETEGSRGAVKTPNGGHPVVQLVGCSDGAIPLALQVFIGMADERALKPHAFYQVHRITGKTVTTASVERAVNGTKVLEIALQPEKHMTALIDCAGILKLRNADIEQRTSETDLGRKNTRVRLVFRVHVPQSHGGLLSLQVASQPIECSQRSAQELPAVERQDLDGCSVLGHLHMVLTGQNFTSDSKVLFSEKTQDGQQIWEVEATVDRDKTQPTMLFVTVPPYRDPTVLQPARVNFCVMNGRKKRSQPQHFTYTPLKAIKTEPFTNYRMYGCVDPQAFDLRHKSLHHHDIHEHPHGNHEHPHGNHEHPHGNHEHRQSYSLPPILYHVRDPDAQAAAYEQTPAYSEEEEEEEEEGDDKLLFYPSIRDTLSGVDAMQLYHHGWNQPQGGHHPAAAACFPVPVPRHEAGPRQRLYASLAVPHLSARHPSVSAHRLHSAQPHLMGQGYRGAGARALPDGSDPLAYAHAAGLLGKSPPPAAAAAAEAEARCAQRRDAEEGPEPCGRPLLEQRGAGGPGISWEGVVVVVEGGGGGVKEEHPPGQVCLEDVNDIIKRDLGARSGGAS